MPTFVANHIIGLVIVLLLVVFVETVLGFMNVEMLEVIKAATLAQQNS